ncbi:MAG: transporter associated domain-containing protein, partial [Croceibacterium sp.]
MLGVLQAKDLLEAYLRDEPPDLRACVRPAPNVPDTADALDVLEVIKAALVQSALIHDEYGHFQGVVTNADIFEAIVGVFRTAESEPDAVQRKDGSWLIAGSMPVDEMAERLDVAIPLERSYHTAAGFALDRLGQLAADRREFRHPRLALRDRRYRRPSHRQDPGGASRRSAAAGVELNGGP